MNDELNNQRLIRRYYQYLKLEKGCSPNTVDSYMRHLDKFSHFIKDEGKDYLSAQLDDIHHFSALMIDVGISPIFRYVARSSTAASSFLRSMLETTPTLSGAMPSSSNVLSMYLRSCPGSVFLLHPTPTTTSMGTRRMVR